MEDMAKCVDFKLVIKHLANGTFGENLCRVCLEPLTEHSENIFTSICKEGKEYCIADVLKELCDIKIADNDHYSVCVDCFTTASISYKFCLNVKAKEKMLHYYTDKLDVHVQEVPEDAVAESVCISLPEITMDLFDYDIKDIRCKKLVGDCNKASNDIATKKTNLKVAKQPSKSTMVKKEKVQMDDDNIVVVMEEEGPPTFYKLQTDGTLVMIDYDEKYLKALGVKLKEEISEKQKRRKRDPMTFKHCLRCPMKYRFLAKLKEHVLAVHKSELYSCKICEAITEDEKEHLFHMRLHTSIYRCDECDISFRRRFTITNHMKEHAKYKNNEDIKSIFTCRSCGVILDSEEALQLHTDVKHYKKFTCFYCGRMYSVEASLNAHLKKHEKILKTSDAISKQPDKRSFTAAEARQLTAAPTPTLTCEQCGRGFRGERALMWHARLHNNERPYTCEVCGRGFVSANRRNQHALCAHTVPARRCPLCPALFHLRSMVNSHIKKVHLKKHKRRSRAVRQQDVFWHTEPVPIAELSLELQNDILELKAAQEANKEYDAAKKHKRCASSTCSGTRSPCPSPSCAGARAHRRAAQKASGDFELDVRDKT